MLKSLETSQACAFYAITDNYNECVRPALASKLPLPQRYYLPDRLRDTHQPRLDAAGLWNVNVEKKKDKENQPQSVAVSSILQQRVQQTFAKEKVCPGFGRGYINDNILPR